MASKLDEYKSLFEDGELDDAAIAEVAEVRVSTVKRYREALAQPSASASEEEAPAANLFEQFEAARKADEGALVRVTDPFVFVYTDTKGKKHHRPAQKSIYRGSMAVAILRAAVDSGNERCVEIVA